ERATASRLDGFGGGVDRALELRVWLDGFGCDHDVRAVARGAQRDREADPAARSGHEEGLLCEGHVSAPGLGDAYSIPCSARYVTRCAVRGDATGALPERAGRERWRRR